MGGECSRRTLELSVLFVLGLLRLDELLGRLVERDDAVLLLSVDT